MPHFYTDIIQPPHHLFVFLHGWIMLRYAGSVGNRSFRFNSGETHYAGGVIAVHFVVMEIGHWREKYELRDVMLKRVPIQAMVMSKS